MIRPSEADLKMNDRTPPPIFADSAAARRNAETIRRFFAEVLDHGDPATAARFLSPEFRDSDPARGESADASGVFAKLAGLWGAFEDGRFALREIVAAGDRVVARSIFTGTHTGPFGPLAATGRTVRVPFIDIYALAADGIRGHAHVFDSGLMMHQLQG
jgi:predicted ester cyclase